MSTKSNQILSFATPGAAWRWACALIEAHGEAVITEDGQATKEIRNLVLQVDNPTIGWPIASSGWNLPALDVYYQEQIIGVDNPTGFSYIYGQRIVPKLDQLIEKLKSEPNTRRAVISLWRDADYEIQHPPCWMTLEFLIRHDVLHLTAFIRSNDIKQAWPANAYGLGRLMQHVAEEVGCEVGSLTTISVSGHIYQV